LLGWVAFNRHYHKGRSGRFHFWRKKIPIPADLYKSECVRCALLRDAPTTTASPTKESARDMEQLLKLGTEWKRGKL